MVREGGADLVRETVDVAGDALDVLHSPDMSQEQWEEYKEYLQANPLEARRMQAEETNPDTVRRKNIINAIADSWKQAMDNDPDVFARKIRTIEEDPEFKVVFEAMREYRWNDVQFHLLDEDLMGKVSRRMGGIPRDAKVKVDRERKTPLTLQEACKFGDIRAVQSFLSQTESSKEDRDLDAQDHRGITCLGYAIGANRMGLVTVLSEAGADPAVVDSAGNSGLHYAAAYARREMLDHLLNLGLDINARNHAGLTPLACASQNKHEKIVQQLVDRGGS